MAKIKYTKGELKKQRDDLSLFSHYLPTLQLKKQQLQLKILEIRRLIEERKAAFAESNKSILKWIGLLSDARTSILSWIKPVKILYSEDNIAGVDVWVYKDVVFKEKDYDCYSTPFWVDKAIEALQQKMKLLVEIELLNKQISVLGEELRITTQRVNLFEKVKIPESVDNIRKIRIYLGDQMANAVGISKVAKKKTQTREALEAAV